MSPCSRAQDFLLHCDVYSAGLRARSEIGTRRGIRRDRPQTVHHQNMLCVGGSEDPVLYFGESARWDQSSVMRGHAITRVRSVW